MIEFLNQIFENIINTSLLEWLAVLSAIIYVLLVAKKSILCWPFALFSSFLYIFLCYETQLYLELILQIFYFAMGVYGWLLWTDSKNEQTGIVKWSIKKHFYNLIFSGVLSFLVGFLFEKYTNQAYPYIDSFTTCFSLVATYMVAKKVLENWIYWIIIDFVSIFLYQSRGLYLTAVLFVIYTTIAIIGYFSWKQKLKKQNLHV